MHSEMTTQYRTGESGIESFARTTTGQPLEFNYDC